MIRQGSPEWNSLIDEVARTQIGHVFTHETLRKAFFIEVPKISDFSGDYRAFQRAVNRSEFDYWTCIDHLRNDLLTQQQFYLVNAWGEGYRILPASDQVPVIYEETMESIGRALSKFKLVSDNVRTVSIEHSSRDNDLRARIAQIQTIYNNLRK